ncbi:MAG: hypothetical protein QME51_08120, partial [Planctomycetota bacterium]|nr:hypothetical protein [Planctomycetota bacterium]
EKGSVLSEDLVGALFAREIISRRGGTKICVTPVNSSFLIEETVALCGGRLEYCRIGQPETIKAIKQCGASFSYEESGKYYFCEDSLCPDALLTSLKLLEIMAGQNKPLSSISSEFPQFYQVKHSLTHQDILGGATAVPSGTKGAFSINKLFQKIEELWKSECREGSERDLTIDGLKRIYKDKSWLLIRKSGTEPLIRIYSDAPSRERAEQLVRQGEELVRKAVEL